MGAVAVILGSAFDGACLEDLELTPEEVATAHGPVTLYRSGLGSRPAYALYRHGLPHRWLPHQVPFRAHAAALAAVGCGALLVTSSVGVLDPAVPLGRPLLVGDLLMPDNRLPDGSACSMWPSPSPEHGHLVLEGGLFSASLGAQLRALTPVEPGAVTFAYVPGPRTKTPAENRLWATWGAQVNSMSLGPEVVLANELGIPTAGLVTGHKLSHPDHPAPDQAGVARSLREARDATRLAVRAFLQQGAPVDFENQLYRFQDEAPR